MRTAAPTWGVAALAAVACGVALGAQTPSFRASVEAVQVDVLATREGRLIEGLRAADFELRDSGVLQQVDLLTYGDAPIHLLLALDTSSSLRGESIQHLKQAARAAVEALRPEDRAALLTFSHEIALRMSWNADRTAVLDAIDAVEASGATALHDAAFAALGLRRQEEGRLLVLLFSDGIDTASWLGPLRVVEQAQRADAVVSAVQLQPLSEPARAIPGVGRLGPLAPGTLRRAFQSEPSLFRQEFLAAITDETGGDLLTTRSTEELRAAFVSSVARFKTRYVLAYSPTNVPGSGWHPIEVRLKSQRGEVRARRGYLR
jgi:VWFA-related protein